MGNILPKLLGIREEEIADQQKRIYAISSRKAYLYAIIISILVMLIYIAFKRQHVRYSTALTIFAVTFLIVVDFLDFPDQHWFQIISFLVIGLLLFEIIGYEIMRILQKQNKTKSIKSFFTEILE